MKKFSLLVAALGLFVASAAVAQETQTKGSSSQMSDSTMMDKDAKPMLGVKTWKERINTVARKRVDHDIQWLDSRDRTGWNGYTVWQGIRDERPMIARKTTGYHEPRPHATRRERVLLISRGPIQGPGFAE